MKFLCVHSLTCIGSVGLRPYLDVLGADCLPLPSVVLSGPGNMPGVKRLPLPVGPLLDSALAALSADGESVSVVVGYLADAGQIPSIAAAIATHRSTIATVVVDPICGDQGRAYVGEDLIRAWPVLLELADWALPNLTEVELLTGKTGDSAVRTFRERWPQTRLIVTGGLAGFEVEIRLEGPGLSVRHRHERAPVHVSGTGDRFAALWLRNVWSLGHSPVSAMREAGNEVAQSLGRTARIRSGN